MISLSSILDIINEHKWTILLQLFNIGLLLFLYYLTNRVTEGFEVGSSILPIDKIHVCPMLKLNIKNNSALLDDYNKRGAVTSASYTMDILENFKTSYDVHDCEAYLKTMPPPKPKENVEMTEDAEVEKES